MDWKKIIHNLIESGLTQSQIAEACGTGQSHISALLRGIRECPSWHLGEALIGLHKDISNRSETK